jgi:hypothetical protein
MLILSLVVLVLADVGMYHSFVPQAETVPFISLIVLCVVRLLWRARREPK